MYDKDKDFPGNIRKSNKEYFRKYYISGLRRTSHTYEYGLTYRHNVMNSVHNH